MKTFENTTITYKEIAEECKEFQDKSFRDGFEAYLEKQGLKGAINLGNSKLSTNGYVGVIKYKNFQLDILPKLLANQIVKVDDNGITKQSEITQDDLNSETTDSIIKNLIFMLNKTQNLEIKSSDYADISNCQNPFLEVLIREYANSLFEALKRLTPRNYVREEDNLNYLKGKLKFTENIRYNCANKAKFYCEYDEFSENNELNRLFLFVSKCLFHISKNSNNKKVLSHIMNYFCDLPFEVTDKYKAEKIILTRNQKLFEHSFMLAKMFLNRISVDISRKSIENLTILWNMNKLFEEFVSVILSSGLKNYKVYPQSEKQLLCYGDGKPYKRKLSYVDIYLEKEDSEKRIVLDTKYKISSFDTNDIYQVSTYCLIHKTPYAILFYPADYKYHKENVDNKYFFKHKNSYKLNTDKTDVFINKVYVNLYHEKLEEITNKVESELGGIFDEIIKKETKDDKLPDKIKDILKDYDIKDKNEPNDDKTDEVTKKIMEAINKGN